MAMLLNFGVVINAILVVVGIVWCREMLGRWRRDFAEIRAPKDPADRQALVFLWVVTALIVLLLVNFAVGLLRNVGLVS